MRYLFVAIVIISFSCKGKKEVPGCERFKTGTFVSINEIDGAEYIVHRTDSIQLENNKNTGSKSQLKIKWTDPCTYELSFIYYEGDDEFMRDKEGFANFAKKPIVINIVETAEYYYIFEGSRKGEGAYIRDTLWQLLPPGQNVQK